MGLQDREVEVYDVTESHTHSVYITSLTHLSGSMHTYATGTCLQALRLNWSLCSTLCSLLLHIVALLRFFVLRGCTTYTTYCNILASLHCRFYIIFFRSGS